MQENFVPSRCLLRASSKSLNTTLLTLRIGLILNKVGDIVPAVCDLYGCYTVLGYIGNGIMIEFHRFPSFWNYVPDKNHNVIGGDVRGEGGGIKTIMM